MAGTEPRRSVAEAARSLGVSEKQPRHGKAVLAEQGQAREQRHPCPFARQILRGYTP